MVDYAIGRRTRLRQDLHRQGVDVDGAALGSERLPALGRAGRALGLADDGWMLVTRRLTYAGGVPIATGALYHDAARFPDFPDRRAALGSTSETYRSYGIDD